MQEQHDWMDVERRSGTYHFGVKEGREQGREEGLEVGIELGREEGLERGREEGLERGREEGLERGREEGLERGRVALIGLIFDLLGERGITLDAQAEAQIRSCEDLSTLQRWVRRAVHAANGDELLLSGR